MDLPSLASPMPHEAGAGAASDDAVDACLEQVLEVLRPLALELGGPRALRAVAPAASLERDVGLGSLERVELLLRLEAALDRELDDRLLVMDSAVEIARALASGVEARALFSAERAAAQPVAREAAASAATLHQALRDLALAEPHRAHVYLREDDGREWTLAYGRLWDDATAVAGGLGERGIRPGDTVALMLPTGLDFLRAFMGILLARAVAVPLYPPARLDRLEEYILRQRRILANARARCLVTIPEAMPVARALRTAGDGALTMTTADELAHNGARVEDGAGTPDDPALIQYTSGSTGHPRGVLLTHANLVANIHAIAEGVDLRPTDVAVSWLPLYHDMGLIGSWLFCLYHGIPIALMSPLAFLARPERWLWAIHRRWATLSAAPNFAFELCVRRIPDQAIEGLDLSSWRCALNGSEPVSPDTLERFARRFARYGFRRDALMPVYGLAESSVALCLPPVGRGARVEAVSRASFALEPGSPVQAADEGDDTALRFVSVGSPLPRHEVRVVDDAGVEVAERVIGRLTFRGPSAMRGYFRQPDATAEITLPGGWLDSGDLAYASAGELYIAGRRKDVIIVGGRNLVPQEIEEVAGAVEGARKGCVAAFGVADETRGTEKLVVVVETRLTERAAMARLESAVVAEVAAAIGVPPDDVLVVPPGSIPKTPSGKIRRGEARQRFVTGTLGGARRVRLRRRLALLAGMVRLGAPRAWARVARGLYLAYLGVAVPAASLTLGLATWALVMLLPGRRAAFGLARLASRVAAKLALWRLSAEGLAHLDGRSPCILAANHASYADVPALVALLPMDFVFVAKREVRTWPFIGAFVRKARHPTVDRWDPQRSVADTEPIAEAIRRGEQVLFFPEGTFTAATGLRPFRLGAFEAAVATGTPVVPLALRGTRRVLRDGEWLPRPGAVSLWVGPPIAPEGREWRDVITLRDKVAEAIAAHCGEPRLELVAGGPLRA